MKREAEKDETTHAIEGLLGLRHARHPAAEGFSASEERQSGPFGVGPTQLVEPA